MTQRMRLVPEVATYWSHKLFIERQLIHDDVTRSPDHPFGVPGEDFSNDESCWIETTPLYAASPNGGRLTDAMRMEVAKTIYLAKFPAIEDHVLEDHFDWYERGRGDPDSSVHYSNVAVAIHFADAAIAALGLPLASEPPPAATEEGR